MATFGKITFNEKEYDTVKLEIYDKAWRMKNGKTAKFVFGAPQEALDDFPDIVDTLPLYARDMGYSELIDMLEMNYCQNYEGYI